MGSISVRKIDNETLERLRRRARRDGVSMEEEVRCILQAAVAAPERIGDLALAVFGPDHGVELDRPAHGPQGPADLER